jgi:hypothetical protein
MAVLAHERMLISRAAVALGFLWAAGLSVIALALIARSLGLI